MACAHLGCEQAADEIITRAICDALPRSDAFDDARKAEGGLELGLRGPCEEPDDCTDGRPLPVGTQGEIKTLLSTHADPDTRWDSSNPRVLTVEHVEFDEISCEEGPVLRGHLRAHASGVAWLQVTDPSGVRAEWFIVVAEVDTP